MEKPVNIQNRKAGYDYHFLEKYEAGVQLLGSEVKSIKAGRVTLVDSFCYFDNGELWCKAMTITPVDANYVHEPQRNRKLLLHRKELNKLENSLVKGMTIVITHVYSTNGKIKFGIALAKGKRDYDKRQAIKEREAQKEINSEQL